MLKMKWGSYNLLVKILLFWSMELILISKANAALDPEEENVLEVLRVAVNLPLWKTGDPCNETWIECSNSTTLSTVLALKLGWKNIRGTIPPDIAKLRNARDIEFHSNQLTGPLPDFSNMTSLTTLYIVNNSWDAGPIPDLSKQSVLRFLDAALCNFQGTIPAFENNTLLETLRLQLNNLTSIPSDFRNLTSLGTIDVHSNIISGKLPELPSINSQKFGISVYKIDFSNNSFTGEIPTSWEYLDSLERMYVSNNQLSGSVPEWFGNLSQLQYLSISNNSWDAGPIPDMSKLLGLRSLDAELCNFQGAIPVLENNKLLQNLTIPLNNLTSIPSDLRNLTWLEVMDVHGNIISGKLPELPSGDAQPSNKLWKIDFSNNSFTGEIPTSWEYLSFLQEMQLGENRLSGSIPKGIGNLRSLRKLNLSYNFFSGPIPEEITSLADLQTLDLRNNELSGMVPEWLGNLSQLQSLYLDNNNFTGIPSALATKEGLNISIGNLTIIFSNETGSSPAAALSSGGIVGIVVGALCVGIILIVILLLIRRKKYKHHLSREDMPKSAQAFRLKQIKAMTQNYKKLIGKGGFGPVYYGILPSGKEVAVKVKAMDSKQGEDEFLNEVRLLSRLHHRNLVPLVGYCLEAEEQILVYTYMSQGSLYAHLHHHSESSSSQGQAPESATSKPLDWRTRIDIAINSARGLEYLHKDCNPPVIHRDVKSSNILLNDKLEAKFGDLGISKQLQAPEPDTEEELNMTGITTAIKGTLGYLDPEYVTQQRLTTKSDVFGFGIILLEIITGKKAQSQKFPDIDARSLKEWVEGAVAANNLKSIVDLALNGEYNEEGMLMVVTIALSCLRLTGSERPEMGEIVHTLIEAFQMEKKIGTESGLQIYDGITGPLSSHDQLSIPFNADSPYLSSISTDAMEHQSWNTNPR